MRRALREYALGSQRRRIGADRDARKAQAGRDVVFAHHVIQRADAAAAVDQQLEIDIPRIGLSLRGDLGDALADDRLIELRRRRRDLDALEGRRHQQVFPAIDLRFDFLARAWRGSRDP